MKKFVRVLALALAVLMIAALVGCAKTPASSAAPASQAPSSAAPAASQQPEKDYKDTKFTIAWWGSDSRHTATTQLIEEFEKDYKNLKIDVEYFGWGDYWTKMTTHAAAKDLPDVFQMDYGTIVNYVDGQLLLPLDSMIENKAIDLTDTSADTISAGKIDGKMYAIVTGVNSPAIIYNPEFVKEAGITIRNTPTLDELLAAAKTIKEKTGAGLTYFFDFAFFTRMYRNVDKWSTDGKSCGFDAETLAEFWKYITQGLNEGWLPGPDAKAYDSPQAGMADKAFWACPSYSNQIAIFEQESGLELELMVLPTTDKNKSPSFMKPNMLWSVAVNTKEADLAAAFLNYYVNNTKTYDITGLDRGMPISSKIRDYMSGNLTPVQKKYADFQSLLEDGHASPIYPPEPAKATEAGDVLNEYTELIKYGEIKEADFLAKAQECIDKANKILKSE